jgi:hypothetical protein
LEPRPRYQGEYIHAVELEGAAIVVSGTGIAHERRIPKTEFEKIFKEWRKYISQDLSRTELNKKTGSQNSSYIISIFNWTDSAQSNTKTSTT